MITFQDDYPTCERTYVTFRLFHDELDPDVISRTLQISPSEAHRRGDQLRSGRSLPVGSWFLSSEKAVSSRDVRRHIVWILNQIECRKNELVSLRNEGYEMDLFCFWASMSGHGGPELNHEIMNRLASLQLDISFDVYL